MNAYGLFDEYLEMSMALTLFLSYVDFNVVAFFIESQNHRMAWVEKDHNDD